MNFVSRYAIGSAEEAVLSADDARLHAMENMDLVALEEVLADELIYIHSSGKHDSKSAYLTSARAGHVRYSSVKRRSVDVAMAGDLASLSGQLDIVAHIDGQERRLNAKFLGTWVRRREKWALIAISMVRDAGD